MYCEIKLEKPLEENFAPQNIIIVNWTKAELKVNVVNKKKIHGVYVILLQERQKLYNAS